MLASALLLGALCGGSPVDLSGQTPDLAFTDWVNATIQRIVATRIEQASSSRQLEAPSVSRVVSSLLDHASASDLIGLALSPPTFPRGGEGEATAQAFTISPYAIASALLGDDPNDPWRYQDTDAWRLFSITLGFDGGNTADTTAAADQALLVGFKLKLWNGRNVDPDGRTLDSLRTVFLPSATDTYRALATELQQKLHEWEGGSASLVDFLRSISDAQTFSTLLAGLSEERMKSLVGMIEARIDPFVVLDQQTSAVVSKLRGAPELSLAFNSRISEIGRDEYQVTLALDRALAPGVDWTANASLEVRAAFGALEETRGGSFATGVSIRLGPESLQNNESARLSVAASGTFMPDTDSQIKLQGKLTIPLAPGLSFPMSVTWANRTELVDEQQTFGHLGVTLDTALLLRALGG